MKYKSRIVGSGEERLDQILFNPRNWRIHPIYQQNALKGVLEQVGWVQQVIVNQRTGNLVDGHLRCQLAAREGNEIIPVVYVDISEDEEALILATLDPIAGMAVADKQKLGSLLGEIETDNENVQKLIDEIGSSEWLEFTSTDREGQGIGGTWNVFKQMTNVRVQIGDVESYISTDLFDRLKSKLEKDYQNGILVPIQIEKMVIKFVDET